MSSSANCADNLFKISSSSSFPSDHPNPNPNSAQDYYNPPFLFSNNLYSPSPFFDELHDSPLNQIFLFQNHQLIMSANHHQLNNITNTDHQDPTVKKTAASAKCNSSTNNAVDASSLKLDVKEANRLSKRARNLGAIPRRRTGKKDRHSKICTAQGIRDRRMRLSLQVARKFFDLQDTLGYDKASHTIEWLFNQSKEAIKELAEDRDPEAKISEELSNFISDECEDVVSGIIEANNYSNNNNDVYKESRTIIQSPPNSMPLCIGKDERNPPQQVPQCKPNYTRESRDKARARARRRTLEKTMIKRSKSNPSDDDDHLRKLGFQNSPDFEEVVDDDQESKYNNNYSFGGVCDSVVDLHQQQLGDVGTIEKLLMMGNSSSSMSSLRRPTSDYQDLCSAVVPAAGLYNVDQQSGTLMGFLGNWNMLQNNVDRTNPIDYGVLITNQDSLAGNPNPSIYSATPKFP